MPKYADPKTGQVYDYGTDPSLNADIIKGLVSVPDTTPTGSSVYKPTTLPSGLSGYTDPMGNFSTTLNTESLTPQLFPTFPPAPQDNNNYSGLLSGGQATIDALNKYFTTPPTSTADLYNTAYNQSGIEQKQQDVLNAQTSTKQAQAKLVGINAQLAGINAEAQAIPIRLQQQSEGRGITAGGLAPIQTGLLRENALKALPLQAQALGAQAEIASAQGNQELAQKSLEMAQSKLDTIFKIRSQDAENTYNYQKDLRDKVLTYATEAEKVRLQNAQKIADQKHSDYVNEINDNQQKIGQLMASGQADLASKFSLLDPNSPTYRIDKAKLLAQTTRTTSLPKITTTPSGGYQISGVTPTQNAKFNSLGLTSVQAENAVGIATGQRPPLTGFGMNSKEGQAVTAGALALGYDMVKASNDWTAMQKRIATMNGTQQVRLQQAVTFSYDSLDIIEQLNNEWKAGGFPLLNKAQLIAAKNGVLGANAQSLATRLDAQINDLTSELGTVYKGGNSSTDESLKLAAGNLNSSWSQKTLQDAINLARTNLQIRKNSIVTSEIIPGNLYNSGTIQNDTTTLFDNLFQKYGGQ